MFHSSTYHINIIGLGTLGVQLTNMIQAQTTSLGLSYQSRLKPIVLDTHKNSLQQSKIKDQLYLEAIPKVILNTLTQPTDKLSLGTKKYLERSLKESMITLLIIDLESSASIYADAIAQFASEQSQLCLTFGLSADDLDFDGNMTSSPNKLANLVPHVHTLFDLKLALPTFTVNQQDAIEKTKDLEGVLDIITSSIELFTSENPSFIDINFADIKTMLHVKNNPLAIASHAKAQGPNRAKECAEKVLAKIPKHCNLTQAQKILIQCEGPNSLTLDEVTEAVFYITDLFANEPIVIIGINSNHTNDLSDEKMMLTIFASDLKTI